MKSKNFKFVPILALLICFFADAFADEARKNIKIAPATPFANEYRNDGGMDWKQGWKFRRKHSHTSAPCNDSDCIYGLYNFSDINEFPKDMLNQKPVTRFGGEGTYVFGDYAVTGNPVISSSWSDGRESFMFDSKGAFINNGGGFTLNSSKATMSLPKGVIADDIVFVGLYWQGNIFNNNAKRGFEATKGYQNVQFKMKSSKSPSHTAITTINRDRCSGFGAWNFKNTGGPGSRNQMRLQYGCYKDITKTVRKNFIDYSDSIEFAVGNIKTSDGWDEYGAVFLNGDFATAKVGSYGGWGIILVYDKNAASRRKLMQDLQSDASVAGKIMSYKEALKFKNNYFKPKNVTIYGDFITISPWSNGYSPVNVEFNLGGFYTPKHGDVNAKLGFLGFGGEKHIKAGEYFRVENKNTHAMDSLFGTVVNTKIDNQYANVYDGSISMLKLGDDGKFKLEYPSGSRYNTGFDLDEFDLSKKMTNAQSDLKIELGGASIREGNGKESADQNFISMVAVSADMYVPQMCYQYEVYRAPEWLKFFDFKTGLRFVNSASGKQEFPNGVPVQFDKGTSSGAVVPGESLFYRVRFENRNKNSEDAVGTKVIVDFGEYNTYSKDSSTIDNSLAANAFSNTDQAIADDAKLVYLKDGDVGAYVTASDVLKEDGQKVNDIVYKDKQLNSLTNNNLTFYIGQDAGKIEVKKNGAGNVTDKKVIGGLMKPGNKVYSEFNATVNTGTLKFVPPTYRVGYNLQLNINGKTTVIEFDDGADIEECVDVKRNQPAVMVLNGLQVVNQNFKAEEAKDQDDRLYTQAAELKFDANLIFRPNLSSLFKCIEKDADGNCINYGSDVLTSYPNLFERGADGKSKYKGYSGREKLQKFNLPGKLFLSVIDAKQASSLACKFITDTYKIPFKMKDAAGGSGADKYDVDHEIKFEGKKILKLSDIDIGDAYRGVSFMLSYRPDGLDLPDSSRKVNPDIEDALRDRNDYYLNQYKERLLQKEGYYKPGISETEKANILASVLKKVNELEKQLKTAQTWLGTAISSDGTFHVCNSDSFVVRPAYFEADTNKITKYAKFVDVDASGDITRKGESTEVYHASELRLGGDYTDNADILNSVIYAKSSEGHGVPNYDTTVGDISNNQMFRVRNSYNKDSDPDNQDPSYKISQVRTFLRPFISNQCYANIAAQSYYVRTSDNKIGSSLSLGTTKDGCQGGAPMEYKGFKFNPATRSYEYDGKTDVKDPNFGKYLGKCSTAGTSESFDTFYTRVWDKTAIKLWADFQYRSSKVANEGYVSDKKMKYSPYLIDQSKKEPKDKDSRPALLYTSNLVGKGEIFNYYNVGDVLLSVYDNSWTDNYGDQTYSKEWKRTTCIINSPTNKRDEFGRIGCDVGMKDNKYLVLRYRPDRVRISMTSLDNGSYGVDAATGIVGSADNNVTAASPNTSAVANTGAFTYYNMPDIETDIVVSPGDNPKLNKAVTKQLDQLATLKYNSVAYLSNKVYPDVIATLYDGRMGIVDAGNKFEALCGFASNLNLQINFLFDCSRATNDARCSTDTNAANLRRTTNDVDYMPYPENNNIRFTIPRGTQFFTSQFCNSGSTGYDSRCFKYNARTLSGTITNESTSGMNYQLPLPLQTALNYYTNAALTNGFISVKQNGSDLQYDSKNRNLTLLARGFNGGQTPNARVYFNFDRMHKTPSQPLLIYAEDFAINRNALSLSNQIEPASFDKNYNAIPSTATTYESYNNNGIQVISEDFDVYLSRKRNELNTAQPGLGLADNARYIAHINSNTIMNQVGTPVMDLSDNVGTYVLFVYGKANDINDGAVIYEGDFIRGVQVPIGNSIYCGKTSGCAGAPVPSNASGTALPYLAPAGTIFDTLSNINPRPDTSKFLVNTFRIYSANDIERLFVNRYLPENGGVDADRQSQTNAGIENVTFTAAQKGKTKVQVITNPWLIYTPNDGNTRIWVNDKINTGLAGVPQYYNFFYVNFRNAGTWGGEGGVKSGTEDDVGSFAGGKELDDIARDKGQMGTDTGEKRSIHNQRIDW